MASSFPPSLPLLVKGGLLTRSASGRQCSPLRQSAPPGLDGRLLPYLPARMPSLKVCSSIWSNPDGDIAASVAAVRCMARTTSIITFCACEGTGYRSRRESPPCGSGLSACSQPCPCTAGRSASRWPPRRSSQRRSTGPGTGPVRREGLRRGCRRQRFLSEMSLLNMRPARDVRPRPCRGGSPRSWALAQTSTSELTHHGPGHAEYGVVVDAQDEVPSSRLRETPPASRMRSRAEGRLPVGASPGRPSR